ncbi:hypothetical protein SCHPADRAFT_886170 [Schizopora paradoxa]|uniref:Uncharacterized protein n=1 Tax=Schizopora paradoxa TaxID=27342 RepID=A0A0H2S2C4_9AGAM|nr:hypothetical protein SCHPADRAFT_886170 [Schizopora paradoxa]
MAVYPQYYYPYYYFTPEAESMQIRLIIVQNTLTRLSATIERFARIYNQVNQIFNSASTSQNIEYLLLELNQTVSEELELHASVHSEVDKLFLYRNELTSAYQQGVRRYLHWYYNAAKVVIAQHQYRWKRLKKWYLNSYYDATKGVIAELQNRWERLRRLRGFFAVIDGALSEHKLYTSNSRMAIDMRSSALCVPFSTNQTVDLEDAFVEAKIKIVKEMLPSLIARSVGRSSRTFAFDSGVEKKLALSVVVDSWQERRRSTFLRYGAVSIS